MSDGRSKKESDVALAFSALFRETGVPHQLEGAYLTEMAIAAGRHDQPYSSSDVSFGLLLRERDSNARQSAQSEQRRHEAGRYGGAMRERMRRHELSAGVCFMERRVPPGRDDHGHHHPAQIRFHLGSLVQSVIAKASAAQGRRSTRFEIAASEIIASHRQQIGLQKHKAPRRVFSRSIDFQTRAKIAYTHFSEMKELDSSLAGDFLFFIAAQLGLGPSPDFIPYKTPAPGSAPPGSPLQSFLVGTLQCKNPGTLKRGGIGEKAQQNNVFLGQKSAAGEKKEKGTFNRRSIQVRGDDEAALAADVFDSVRATKFSFLLKNDSTENVVTDLAPRSRKLKTVKRKAFNEKFIEMRERSCADKLSLIVGARSRSQIHLDDCGLAEALRLAPYAYAVIETSPDRFHVFLALRKGWDNLKNIRQRLIQRLKALHPETELNSGSGSVRWPGTYNFKPDRLLPDGSHFLVRIVHASPSLFTTEDELQSAGLLAEVEVSRPPLAAVRNVDQKMPDYARILAKAPLAKSSKRKGLPDRSWADFMWARMYASWGASLSQIESGLLVVSECARERGAQYTSSQATRGRDEATLWVKDSNKAA